MRYPHPYKSGAIGGAAITLPAIALLMAASSGLAQTRQVRARDLYFEPDAPAVAGGAAAGKQPAVSSVDRPVRHLGLRYNLILVDPATRKSRAVDPDSNFSRGNCFAVEFSPNRDGHLYISNRGSSGEWQLLLPSAAMPEEASLVRAGKTVRVPEEYCFMLNDPPGVETLVVAVTERKEDIDELRKAIRGGGGPDMLAVRNEVQQWQQQMGGRDLIMQKMDEPESAGEQPHSVYVVQTAAGESTRLVIEIRIRHE